jgi:uncharacterized protein (TIGR03437 family)
MPTSYLRATCTSLILLASFAARLAAQSPPPVQVTSFATGLRPIGITVTSVPVTSISLSTIGYVVVANSGDDTVSFGLAAPSVVKGIPSPYGVADCGPSVERDVPRGNLLVSSPSDRSVWLLSVLNLGAASVIGKIQAGAQLYSVACYGLAVASNPGDNSLMILDRWKLAVVATIPDVPGSRAVHGITVAATPSSYVAWVAGTDANVVTLVSLSSLKVLNRIPVSRPTAVVRGNSGYIYVASGDAGTITAYDPVTVSSVPSLQFASVPNPQDINISALGNFAISAGASPGQESLWRFDLASKPGMTGRVVDMPGAAALASHSPGDTSLYATSTTANRAYLIQQASGPYTFGISNAASFDQASIAPGSLASVFLPTGATQSFKAASTPLPLALGGVTVSFGGTLSFDTPNNKWVYSSAGSVPAALLFVGPKQVNLQIPPGVAPASGVAAQLTKADGTTDAGVFNLSATAPGIFSVSQDGRGQAAVQNSDFSQNGSSQVLPGSRPAARGEVIIIYATGAGDTTPSLAAGEAALAGGSPLVLTKVQPSVTIGGVQARVLFSGLAPGFVGLWQIDTEVPASVTPGAVVPLVITAGGVQSNTVTIAVQ